MQILSPAPQTFSTNNKKLCFVVVELQEIGGYIGSEVKGHIRILHQNWTGRMDEYLWKPPSPFRHQNLGRAVSDHFSKIDNPSFTPTLGRDWPDVWRKKPGF